MKMKKKMMVKSVSLLLAASVLLSSCASTTLIQSTPSGAVVYLNGENVGVTPYQHTDTKIVGSTTTVRLEKEGYEEFNTSFSRDEEVDAGAIVGGFLVLIPFLWAMKYKPTHSYELKPATPIQAPVQTQPVVEPQTKIQTPATEPRSKAERLRELKALLDEKIITQEEFEKEKKKILEEEEK